jgi:acetolactate synthase-1/3 small subunit
MSVSEQAGVSTAPAAENQSVLILLVRDRGDALERVLAVLRRRGPAFSTATVAASEDKDVSRITINLRGSRQAADQAIEHLRKLVDVRWAMVMPVSGVNDGPLLREFALIRVACNAQTRRDVVALAQQFAARVVDVADTTLTLEATGSTETIEGLLSRLQPIGIRELTRTGQVAV